MKKSGWLSWLVWILVVIGSLNWGLVGLSGFLGGNWNVVNQILGSWPQVESIVYILVGIAGVLYIFGCHCRTCRVDGVKMTSSSSQQM